MEYKAPYIDEQVFFGKFSLTIYFLVCRVGFFLTRFVPCVHGMMLNIYLTSRPPFLLLLLLLV